jgi:nucleoside 2-deoxyribosyltransferase
MSTFKFNFTMSSITGIILGVVSIIFVELLIGLYTGDLVLTRITSDNSKVIESQNSNEKINCISKNKEENKEINNKGNSNDTKMPDIYVAGSWLDRIGLQEKMNELKSMGYFITSRWPAFEKDLNSQDDYALCSMFDIDGVKCADVVLVFMTDAKYAYRGTFTEIGCAIGLDKRIIVITDGVCIPLNSNDSSIEPSDKAEKGTKLKFSHSFMENVFFWHPQIEHVSSLSDALQLINGKNVESPFKKYYKGTISKPLKESIERAFSDLEPQYLKDYTDLLLSRSENLIKYFEFILNLFILFQYIFF